MTYAYGMKGAPAVGNGLGGLPRRQVISVKDDSDTDSDTVKPETKIRLDDYVHLYQNNTGVYIRELGAEEDLAVYAPSLPGVRSSSKSLKTSLYNKYALFSYHQPDTDTNHFVVLTLPELEVYARFSSKVSFYDGTDVDHLTGPRYVDFHFDEEAGEVVVGGTGRANRGGVPLRIYDIGSLATSYIVDLSQVAPKKEVILTGSLIPSGTAGLLLTDSVEFSPRGNMIAVNISINTTTSSLDSDSYRVKNGTIGLYDRETLTRIRSLLSLFRYPRLDLSGILKGSVSFTATGLGLSIKARWSSGSDYYRYFNAIHLEYTPQDTLDSVSLFFSKSENSSTSSLLSINLFEYEGSLCIRDPIGKVESVTGIGLIEFSLFTGLPSVTTSTPRYSVSPVSFGILTSDMSDDGRILIRISSAQSCFTTISDLLGTVNHANKYNFDVEFKGAASNYSWTYSKVLKKDSYA